MVRTLRASLGASLPGERAFVTLPALGSTNMFSTFRQGRALESPHGHVRYLKILLDVAGRDDKKDSRLARPPVQQASQ